MRGMCQTCGATAPLEWFLTEPVSRQVLVTALSLPQAVQAQAIHYLSLFRPATGRGLAPKRALKIVTELRDLVAKGHVATQGKPDRPCPPHIWGRAMEQMIGSRDRLRLPMPNHNYLRQVAWDLADQDDASREKTVVAAERSGDCGSRNADGGFEGVSPELLARLPEAVKRKYGI